MLPSLLTRDIQEGLKQFLVTGFEPADGHFHGLMSRFVHEANQAAWMKGPFIQMGLPFRHGQVGVDYFPSFKLKFPGYSHQEKAWGRLRSGAGHTPASTLVATGTGSGKTECFLYPVMDDAARRLAAGEGGIKALIIYPMNALASDQARRIAGLVASVPAFSKLRVGLFVGGVTKPGDGQVMTPTGVITDRETMRKQPPDILLTNYKMLDYLMLRPGDRALWERNGPQTLRYVVVDELHTFDGAQGTDLALLLRRLRARLKVPQDQWVCVGTSATLGNAQDTSELRTYAGQIFATEFGADAVVTEDRLSAGEFLADAPTEYFLQPRSDFARMLDAQGFRTPAQAVQAWFKIFFADEPEPTPDDVASPAWRVRLGQLLKQHLLFANLVKRLKGDVLPLGELAEQMQGKSLPASATPHIRPLLEALLVLVAWARRPSDNDTMPLVNLRVQLWLRELRRMVANVAVEPSAVMLKHASSLGANPGSIHLPVVQCRECHTTGWLTRLPSGTHRVSTKLDEIYNTWFGNRPEAARLYADMQLKRPQVDGVRQLLCNACGNLQSAGAECNGCGHHELVAVFRTVGARTFAVGNAQFTRHDDTCPACGARDAQQLLGARSATLGAQVVEHSWASPFNDDKKLIAFSDSVQDAAHRAGFFGARTYLNNVRTALTQAIAEQARGAGGNGGAGGAAGAVLPWPDFQAELERQCHTPGSPLHRSPEAFVSEFIGPNMTWLRDWAQGLMQDGALPDSSRLPARVLKRLLWQTYAEFTYLSHRGRTLERVGVAMLTVPLERLVPVANALTERLREEFGAQGMQSGTVLHWLWGLTTRLRKQGAVMHPELSNYSRDANLYGFLRSQGRNEWLPPMSPQSPRPVFVTLGSHRGFQALPGAGSSREAGWLDKWAQVALGDDMLLAAGLVRAAHIAAFEALERAGVVVRTSGPQGDTLALDPRALVLCTELAQLATDRAQRPLVVPADEAQRLIGMPCVDAPGERYTREVAMQHLGAMRLARSDVRRVIAAEHTGLLERPDREALEIRFKSKQPKPWYENLLSATPTLEMGVDIGDLSQVMLCSMPPNQASFLQRIGRAGRVDGNAMLATLADGASPHDLYFFEAPQEMLAGAVNPPGIFLKAAEVLRRQLFAFCMDDWVAGLKVTTALPQKTSPALDALDQVAKTRFPYTFLDHVLQHEPRLLGSFLALLGKEVDAEVIQRLTQWMQGDAEGDSIRIRLLKVLEDLAKERKHHQTRRKQMDARIQALQQQPRDEATVAEIEAMRRERGKAVEMITEINQRDLLNTLTDAGLIPNYAFPEAGVELKSVLWRRRAEGEEGEGRYVALKPLVYERPANSALSEFAPENRFYANQRRVEIDQVNLSLQGEQALAPWRLCANCHFARPVAAGDADVTCPRCGDAMWGDEAQKRTLLRFRQAIANSDDTRVRIDDSAEDREPKFYLRQLLADFDPVDVREAWQLKAADLPFGFEFVSKVTFRDINFGEVARAGESFKVADREASRPGFRLCRHCGKVQKPQRRNRDDDDRDAAGREQDHSFDCRQRDSDDPTNIIDCLYLYREFSSEALRILVPYTKHGVDEAVVQSFMAALQLGLKRRFGGKVDHLRMTTQDEPGKDGGARRQFVLIYDSVPGGTGYLHQLLAGEAGTLADVLRMALDALNGCACNQDAEKDGCYQCLYQYRLGRMMERVSREQAKAVLSELVNSLDKLEKVSTLSEIFINPNLDSVLESRFIESLRRLGAPQAAKDAGLPATRLVQDIVNGKSGWVLEVADQRYRVEPQVNVGPSDGVAVHSKPDFVIWPWPAEPAKRPIAVFCDGWAHHKDILRDDARKRTALVASGKFWVWSITHQDVKAALDGKRDTDLDSPLLHFGNHEPSQLDPRLQGVVKDFPKPEAGAFNRHGVADLLVLLGEPGATSAARWRAMAVWATFLMMPTFDVAAQQAAIRGFAELWSTAPDWMRSTDAKLLPVWSREGARPMVVGRWSLGWRDPKAPLEPAPGLLLLDDAPPGDADAHHTAWRHALRLYHWLQMLPGWVMSTREGWRDGDAEVLKPAWTASPGAATAPDVPAVDPQWQRVLGEAVEAVQAGLRVIASASVPSPEVGHEGADERGRVFAEAELAWPDHRLAVLTPAQDDQAEAWRGRGWTVVMTTAEGWAADVLNVLSKGIQE
jgi:DEAD/DEAH box helicase domain-containing protein